MPLLRANLVVCVGLIAEGTWIELIANLGLGQVLYRAARQWSNTPKKCVALCILEGRWWWWYVLDDTHSMQEDVGVSHPPYLHLSLSHHHLVQNRIHIYSAWINCWHVMNKVTCKVHAISYKYCTHTYVSVCIAKKCIRLICRRFWLNASLSSQ